MRKEVAGLDLPPKQVVSLGGIRWTVLKQFAAENGHTLAGHNLGLMLYEGQGTTQDFKEATKLLKPFGKNYYPSKHAKWYRLEPNYEYAEAQHALEVMKITH